MRGKPGSKHERQRVDYVVISDKGVLLREDGARIPDTMSERPEVHIPLREWLTWKAWNRRT
jgi:hypothetical protein